MVQDRRTKKKWTQSGIEHGSLASTKASRKGGDVFSIVIARRIHCSSISIHKVAVYDIVLICSNSGSNNRGRVDKGTICYIHGQFRSPMTFTAYHAYIYYIVLSWNLSGARSTWAVTVMLYTIPAYRDWSANAHVQSKITSKNSQKPVQKHSSNEMKNTFLHWRHAISPKDFQMHQQSLDHSYCKRENSLTKLNNSKSVMI
jgi:hypothetical protein